MFCIISGDVSDDVWCSGVIVARLAATKLVTKSGSVYKLKGWLREDEELCQCFSKQLIALFKRGFPVTWEKALSEDLLRFAKKIFWVELNLRRLIDHNQHHQLLKRSEQNKVSSD